MILLQAIPWNPMIWAGQHWDELLGWGVVSGVLYKIFRVVERALQPFQDLKLVKEDITIIKENHLSHMEQELSNVNVNISGLRNDIKESMAQLSEDVRFVMNRLP